MLAIGQQGGHHVSRETIVRRYHAGIKNLFSSYLPLSDQALIIVAIKNRAGLIDVLDEVVWEKIKKGSHDG